MMKLRHFDRLLRNRWTWKATLMLAWAISLVWLVPYFTGFWYGRNAYALLLVAPVFAPIGLIELLDLDDSTNAVYYFIGMHMVFWGAFVFCLANLRYLKPRTLYVMFSLFVLTLLSTLAGCAGHEYQGQFDL